jgi:hypothetical protein
MSTDPARRSFSGSHRFVAGAFSWLALGGAFLLIAILALAPHWLEAERLQERYVRNAIQIHGLQKEILHLDRLAKALRSDADFTSRVASSELRTAPHNQIQIALTPELVFDPRVENQDTTARPYVPKWYCSVLELVTNTNEVHRRLAASAVVLIFLSFFCLHEDGFGGGLRQICSLVSQRWSVRQGRGDEKSCRFEG